MSSQDVTILFILCKLVEVYGKRGEGIDEEVEKKRRKFLEKSRSKKREDERKRERKTYPCSMG